MVQRSFKRFESGRPNTVIDDEKLRQLVEDLMHNDSRTQDRQIQEAQHELTKIKKIIVTSSLRNKNDLFLDRILTRDNKLILHDNRRRSAQ